MHRFVRPAAVLASVAAAVIPGTSAFAATTATSPVLYSSLIPSPGNVISVGFEADQASQFGNEITLTRSAKANTVVVTLSSWACQSGTWNGGDCQSSAGAKFTEPITLNIYHAPSDPNAGGDNPGSGLPGSLILSVTKTFSIPYRPSANTTRCIGDEAGDWFDAKNGECFTEI